jgi:hypothetical protein
MWGEGVFAGVALDDITEVLIGEGESELARLVKVLDYMNHDVLVKIDSLHRSARAAISITSSDETYLVAMPSFD